METDPKNNLKDSILRKIRAERVSMRPRLYFTLQFAALVLVAFAVLVISVFICNFILFSLRINGHNELLGFGGRGLLTFLQFFPWGFLLADIALVLVLESLFRRFEFGYKVPILYVLAGVLLLTAVSAVALDASRVNDRLLGHADRHELGLFDDFFEGARRPPPPPGEGVCRCTVVSVTGGILTVQDPRSTSTLTVLLPANDARATSTGINPGDVILVAGDRIGDTIRAFGLRKLADPDDMK